MKPKALLALALVLSVFALVACGSDSSSDTSSETEAGPTATTQAPAPASEGGKLERSVKVNIANFEYDPDPVQVEAGGKVIWLNEDSAPHTATADDGSFDTGTIEEGKLKSESFKQPGTFTYHCEIHPQMHGTIEVIEG